MLNLLLDLGNVVLDWDPQRILAQMPLSPARREQLQSQLFAHSDWLDFDCGLVDEAALIKRVSGRCDFSPAELAHCLMLTKQSLTEIEPTVALMARAHQAGISQYCLSNMPTQIYNFIKEKPFFNYFSGVVISADVKMIKPSAALFRYTLDHFALRAEDTLFVDDSAANIAAAQALGIECLHFKRSPACYRAIEHALKQ
jgi:putative hydrolase of the HAD superfamily